MSKVATISVSVPQSAALVLDDAVRSGEFVSRDRAAEAAIDAWAAARLPRARTQAELDVMLQAGVDSGPGRGVDEVCDELVAKYAALDREP